MPSICISHSACHRPLRFVSKKFVSGPMSLCSKWPSTPVLSEQIHCQQTTVSKNSNSIKKRKEKENSVSFTAQYSFNSLVLSTSCQVTFSAEITLSHHCKGKGLNVAWCFHYRWKPKSANNALCNLPYIFNSVLHLRNVFCICIVLCMWISFCESEFSYACGHCIFCMNCYFIHFRSPQHFHWFKIRTLTWPFQNHPFLI